MSGLGELSLGVDVRRGWRRMIGWIPVVGYLSLCLEGCSIGSRR